MWVYVLTFISIAFSLMFVYDMTDWDLPVMDRLMSFIEKMPTMALITLVYILNTLNNKMKYAPRATRVKEQHNFFEPDELDLINDLNLGVSLQSATWSKAYYLRFLVAYSLKDVAEIRSKSLYKKIKQNLISLIENDTFVNDYQNLPPSEQTTLWEILAGIDYKLLSMSTLKKGLPEKITKLKTELESAMKKIKDSNDDYFFQQYPEFKVTLERKYINGFLTFSFCGVPSSVVELVHFHYPFSQYEKFRYELLCKMNCSTDNIYFVSLGALLNNKQGEIQAVVSKRLDLIKGQEQKSAKGRPKSKVSKEKKATGLDRFLKEAAKKTSADVVANQSASAGSPLLKELEKSRSSPATLGTVLNSASSCSTPVTKSSPVKSVPVTETKPNGGMQQNKPVNSLSTAQVNLRVPSAKKPANQSASSSKRISRKKDSSSQSIESYSAFFVRVSQMRMKYGRGVFGQSANGYFQPLAQSSASSTPSSVSQPSSSHDSMNRSSRLNRGMRPRNPKYQGPDIGINSNHAKLTGFKVMPLPHFTQNDLQASQLLPERSSVSFLSSAPFSQLEVDDAVTMASASSVPPSISSSISQSSGSDVCDRGIVNISTSTSLSQVSAYSETSSVAEDMHPVIYQQTDQSLGPAMFPPGSFEVEIIGTGQRMIAVPQYDYCPHLDLARSYPSNSSEYFNQVSYFQAYRGPGMMPALSWNPSNQWVPQLLPAAPTYIPRRRGSDNGLSHVGFFSVNHVQVNQVQYHSSAQYSAYNYRQ